MDEYDVNIAVPKSHFRSYRDVVDSLKSRGITKIQEMPDIGSIRVKVDDLKKLDFIRKEGLPFEESRRNLGINPPAPTPQPSPQANAPRSVPWKSPLSDL